MTSKLFYCYFLIIFQVFGTTNFEKYLFLEQSVKNNHVFSLAGFEDLQMRFKQDNSGEKDLTLRVRPQFLNKFNSKNKVLKLYSKTHKMLENSIAYNGTLERYIVGIKLFYMYKERRFLKEELKRVKEILNKTKDNLNYLDIYYKLINTLDVIKVELIDLESNIVSLESVIAKALKVKKSKVTLSDFITLPTVNKSLKSFALLHEVPLFQKKIKLDKQILESEYLLGKNDLFDFVGVGFQVDDQTEDKKIVFEVALNLPIFENSIKQAKSTLSYIEGKKKNALESVQKDQYNYSLLDRTLKKISYYLGTVKKRKREVFSERSIERFVTNKIHTIKKEIGNLKFERDILIDYINIIASFGFDSQNKNINFLKNKTL